MLALAYIFCCLHVTVYYLNYDFNLNEFSVFKKYNNFLFILVNNPFE